MQLSSSVAITSSNGSLWDLLGVCAAAAVGLVLGKLLTRGVAWMLAAEAAIDGIAAPAPSAILRSRIVAAATVLAAGAWWLEVVIGGGSMLRAAGHLVLLTLLAAATWIDLRYRVIPDLITLPGVLVGLMAVWLIPDLLPPIPVELSRSYAAPLLVDDLLGASGPLRTGPLPAFLSGAPAVAGLGLTGMIFLLWWRVCTAAFWVPVDEKGIPLIGRVVWYDPRNLLLPLGCVAIGMAWWLGGERFAALGSSLVGLAASAGLVWATREAASRALGREAMGMGDVTLMAMIGAWLGWQASVLIFFLAVFLGLAHGLLQIWRHRESELPYGPSLCLAAACTIIGWRPLWSITGEAFADPGQLVIVLGTVVLLTAVTLAIWVRIRPDGG